MYKKLKNINSKVYLSLLAIFSGQVLPFAFAPFGYYWVAEISLLLLLFTWFKSTPKWSFLYGWLFGAAFFGFGVYWIYISIYEHGQAPVALAVLILALLVAFMALYPGLLGYLMSRFFPKNNLYKFLLVFPSGFVVLEWVRGWFLSGFPWLFLGYGHIDSPLCGYATIFGVYGVSFAVALTAGAVFSIFYWWRDKKRVFILASFVMLIWVAGFGLAKVNWTKPSGDEIKVSLIQGNILLKDKWDYDNLWTILNKYSSLTTDNFGAQIIVWPEGAIPTYPNELNYFIELLDESAKKNKTAILSGIPFFDENDGNYYNGIIALGTGEGRYYKRHLVPFGEYLPLKFALRWLDKFLIIPMSDFSSGSKDQPGIFAGDILIAPFLCYEIAYPGLVLDYLPEAGLLVVVSDDSWFGDSIAQYQHLEIARMRSLEVGRYQLFSTNTGVTAVIDEKGEIVAKAPILQDAVLSAKVTNVVGSTPWANLGRYMWLPLILLGLWIGWKKRRSGKI